MPSVEEQPRVNRRKSFKRLTDVYEVEAVVGGGSFSTVWRCVHRASCQVRAVKKIDTTASDLSPGEIAHEIAVMKLLRHDCVVRCYDVFVEGNFVNIVVDMFAGGDLIDGLNAHRQNRGFIVDAQLAQLSRQMTAAVAHVHRLQIVHRDIKPENFLSDRPDIGDPKCRVALADFGTALRIDADEQLTSKAGTYAYWPPEMWGGSYSFPVDVWAVGLTSWVLLTGTQPTSTITVPSFASPGNVDYIQACLTKDPKSRPTADEVARQPWLKTPPPTSVPPLRTNIAVKAPQKPDPVIGLLDCLGSFVLLMCSAFGNLFDEKPVVPSKKDLEKDITALTKKISTRKDGAT